MIFIIHLYSNTDSRTLQVSRAATDRLLLGLSKWYYELDIIFLLGAPQIPPKFAVILVYRLPITAALIDIQPVALVL